MILEDQNQHLTSNQLRIMNSSVELTQCMIKACIQNQPFKACIVSKVVDRFPAPTYMYQLGVLSLTKLNVEYTANRQFELRVPNVFTRRDYADVFLDNKIGCKCSCASFLAHPTASKLKACLERIMQNTKKLDNEQNETQRNLTQRNIQSMWK